MRKKGFAKHKSAQIAHDVEVVPPAASSVMSGTAGATPTVAAKEHNSFASCPVEPWFRRFIESAPLSIIGVNSEGTIQLVSRHAETAFGYGPGELLGQQVELLVPERVREIHVEERERYAAAPRARPMGIRMELQARRRDGSEFPVEVGLTPVDLGEHVITMGFIIPTAASRLGK